MSRSAVKRSGTVRCRQDRLLPLPARRYAVDVADPEADEDGVDVTLIRWMLSLTPAERLQFLQERIDDISTIRELNTGR